MCQCWHLSESPARELSQSVNTFRNKVITSQTNIVEGRNDCTEALITESSPDEGLALAHLKSVHENGRITVWVDLELHAHGKVVTVSYALHGLFGHYSLPILHENGLVPGGFDSRTRVP